MHIELFGKNIIRLSEHYIMQVDFQTLHSSSEIGKGLSWHKITLGDENEKYKNFEPYVKLIQSMYYNKTLCEGFILKNKAGKIIATIGVMYKGAKDTQEYYRFENIDAFIFGIYVIPEYRGRSIAGAMINEIMKYIHSKGIDIAYLAVASTNKNTIKAYQKIGCNIVKKYKFLRTLKMNIPHYRL